MRSREEPQELGEMSSLLIHQHQGAVVRTRVDPVKSMAFHRQAVLSLNPPLPSLPSPLFEVY